MNYPDKDECIVTGSLGFVLRVSQIYGVAPCKFKKVPEGWRVSISRSVGYYGKAIILMWIGLTLTALLIDFCLDKESSIHLSTTADIVVSFGSMLMTSAVLLVELYSGVNRMQVTISCLAQIQKINAKISDYGPRKSYENIQRLLTVWSLLVGHIIVIVDCGILFYEIIVRDSDIIMEGIYAAFYLVLITLKILILQLSLVFINILSSFNHLNDCLKKLLIETYSEALNPRLKSNLLNSYNNTTSKFISNKINSMTVKKETTKSSSTTAAALRDLGLLYCSLSDIVSKIDDSLGIYLLPLIVYFLLYLVVTPYNLITRLFEDHAAFYRALLQFSWAAYHGVDMLMIIEPCHQTQEQMYRTKHLISQWLRFTPSDDYELITQLELFYKHLESNEVVYTPLKMFDLDRGVIAPILASVMTYLLAIVDL